MPRSRNSVPPVGWGRYKDIVTRFIDEEAGKQPFLWLRKIQMPLAYGEDKGIVYEPVQLDGLFQYNYIKTWPMANNSMSGEIDINNTVLYISAKVLRVGGFLDQYGYWNFDWSEDRFILNGKVYKPDGDTQVAQAKDEALLFFLVLQREDQEETVRILNTYVNRVSIVNKDSVHIYDISGSKLLDINKLPIMVMEKPKPFFSRSRGEKVYLQDIENDNLLSPIGKPFVIYKEQEIKI